MYEPSALASRLSETYQMLEVVSYLKLDSTPNPNPNVPCNRPWRDERPNVPCNRPWRDERPNVPCNRPWRDERPNVPCNRPSRDKSIVGVNSSLVAQRETVLQVAIDTSFKLTM